MKIKSTLKYLFVICLWASFSFANAQTSKSDKAASAKEVIRGERPAINLAAISDQAFEPSIIRIKFKDQLSEHLDQSGIIRKSAGAVLFGIPSVDKLNQKYAVGETRNTFFIVMQNAEFDARHRLWGFHLWYDLIVPAGTDIRTMVEEYALSNDVAIAEPVYKKHLIGTAWNATGDTINDNTASTNFTPNDPRFIEQWHYNNTGQSGGTIDADIDLPEAWEITKGNPNVIVAVVDAGISYTHADLSGNMWSGRGYDFVNNTTVITAGSHGTHVAGTIAAATNNAVGVSGVAGGSGAADGVRLMTCQVATPTWSISSGFENAYVWAADHGAAITSNSWGYDVPGTYNQYELDAIDYFNANGGGSVMEGGITFFAAGNSGSDTQVYPAYYSGTYSVAATNHLDKKASYSTFNTHVDISAPGGDATAGVLSTYPGNAYGSSYGTSMACPHAAGVAALILSLAPGQFTAQQVKDILSTTADDVYTLNPAYTGKLGSGRLNAYQALNKTQTLINPLTTQPPASFTATAVSTDQINLAWSLNSASDSVVLAWNNSYTFGVPSGNYQPGTTISGGGTVLYKGKLTSFNHTSLNSGTPGFYALWSKNGNDYSVVSLKASDTTSAALPFAESFTAASFPMSWSQRATGNTIQNWSVSATTYAGGTANEMKSVYQTEPTGTTRLITPPISTLGVSQLSLSFGYKLFAYGFAETIKVQSSTNGLTWTDESWSVTSATSIGPATVNATISNNTNNLTTYLAFMLTGNLSQYYWYVDDVSIRALNTWAGGSSDDWNNSVNWSLNMVPNADQDVKIPAGMPHQPVITSPVAAPAECNNLTIASGAVVTIAAGKALTVNGNTDNSGGATGLVIESKSTGTGSLKHKTAGLNATIQRYITGNATLTAQTYHFVSIPLTPASSSTSSLFEGSYLYEFDAAANVWSSLGTSTTTPMDETKGYMIYTPVASHTYSFAGAVNAGSFTPLVINAGAGNNLVPNPYPTAIDWNAPSGWTKTNVANSLYLWPSGGSNYATYVDGIAVNGGSNIIPAGQAFIVKVTGNPTFSMNDDVRVHDGQPFYKSGALVMNILKIKATANEMTDETVIRFSDSAVATTDQLYDAWKLFGSDGAPQIYTVASDNEKLAINSLPVSSGAVVVPMNFELKSEKSCSLSFSGMENYHPAATILLEDKLAGKTVNLRQQSEYNFTHEELNAPNRFNLHFNGLTNLVEANLKSGKIWMSDGTLYINTPLLSGKEATIEIYNLMGQKVFCRQIQLDELTTIKTGIHGISVVRIISEKEIITAKGKL